jgi:hypothetical protein
VFCANALIPSRPETNSENAASLKAPERLMESMVAASFLTG